MNIQDFTPFTPTWAEIFEKQKELKFLYEPEARDLFENFDIDCFEDQELFKKYCWRITEELVEAEEAHVIEENADHIEEEMIDALNFSIELLLLYGWDEKDFFKASGLYVLGPGFLGRTTSITFALGRAANCLKNRQWRRSQYLVDLLVFEERLRCFMHTGYTHLFQIFGSDLAIREAWSLKYQVNLFRIQTNY